MTQWLTATEAAAYLRVAHRTVLLWAKTGRIPAHKLSGSSRVTWRFRADELDEFVNGPIENRQPRDIVCGPSAASGLEK